MTHLEPAFVCDGVTSYQGHALGVLRQLPAESVNCIVTSPPYWGLRAYDGEAQLWGGAPDCSHEWGDAIRTPWANDLPGPNGRAENTSATRERAKETGPFCVLCGAWHGALGLEPTPELLVEHLVSIFREARRVLRNDGVLWLNIGDCYATRAGGVGLCPGGGKQGEAWSGLDRNQPRERSGHEGKHAYRNGSGPMTQPNRLPIDGYKSGDLVGIPWMLAFALRADGWFLRCDAVWHKTNGMPESVKDRPTRNHESLFLLAKSRHYYFDQAAIAEPASDFKNRNGQRIGGKKHNGSTSKHSDGGVAVGHYERPQLKRAWELYVQHELTPLHIEAIRACGITDAGKAVQTQSGAGKNSPEMLRLFKEAKTALGGYLREFLLSPTRNARSVWSVPTVPFRGGHFAAFPPELARRCILSGCPDGGVVLDPFAGTGTTGLVASQNARRAVLIELSSFYIEEFQKARLNAAQLRLPAPDGEGGCFEVALEKAA